MRHRFRFFRSERIFSAAKRAVPLPGALCAAVTLFAQAAGAAQHVVTAYSNLTFSPAAITIQQGDTIRFENGGGAHNVHADDDRFICSVNCTTDNGPSSTKWSVVVRFDELGTIGYYCDKHGGTGGGMRGSITVIDRVFVDGFDETIGRSPLR